MAYNGDDPLLVAGSSLLDFGLGSIMSNSANAKSKRAAAAQAALNYHYTTMLMDKQNEYNKPINQMARLREAGLNPNLVYGDGGATMASASGNMSVGQADITPASGTLNVLGKMQALQQMKQSQANIAETDARTQAIDDNIELKRDELEWRKRYDIANLNIQRQLLASQLGLRGAQEEKVREETRYMEDKAPVSVSSDPVGYVSNLYQNVHDGTLDWLNSTFGKRNTWSYEQEKAYQRAKRKGGR